jgi:hypothetical protein
LTKRGKTDILIYVENKAGAIRFSPYKAMMPLGFYTETYESGWCMLSVLFFAEVKED